MDTPGEHDSANTHSASTPAAATAVTAAASASASAPAAPAAPAFAHRWAWGSNGSGVLGLGHTEDLFTPTQAPLIRAQISAAGTAGAGAAPDSADSATVQLPATPTSAIPPALSIVVRFTRMSCGGCHTLAVDEQGRVWSWGDNSRGQLGQDVSSPMAAAAASAAAPVLLSSPALVPALADRRCSWVSAGWSHSACVLDVLAADPNAGSVLFTFGCNTRSQLGLDSACSKLPMLTKPTEVDALRGQGATQVECGGRHTLVLTGDGRVFAFGDNVHGQLGVGDLVSKAQPMLVMAPASAGAAADTPLLCSTVCAGWRHSLFVSVDRKSIHAAGSNSMGELGIGEAEAAARDASSSAPVRSSTKYPRPVSVRLPAAFTSSCSTVRGISCGWSHNVLLSSTSQLFGWGRANFGALATRPTGAAASAGAGEPATGGSKSSKSVPLPVEISLPASIAPDSLLEVACGSEHTVLLTTTDVLVCGWNEHGNLGLGHNRDMSDDAFAFTAIPQLHLAEDQPPITRRVVTGGAAVMLLEP